MSLASERSVTTQAYTLSGGEEKLPKCRFGRQHVWTTALAAALNSNYGLALPLDPEWVWYCNGCDRVGPWNVKAEMGQDFGA